METTLYSELKRAGVPLANHESDLYFPATEVALGILRTFPLENRNATRFINQAPPHKGEQWIEVPFAFIPWWEKRQVTL